MSLARVETKGLTKIYGRTRALGGVDLCVEAGRACALLGPNGAGKSTLLAILASAVRPTGGTVLWGGETRVSRADVGFCAHAPLCYGDLGVRENLDFFARLYGVGDRRARVDALVERLALGGFADRPARACSRGMLQRLSVGRAIVHRPRLLLLDEPFSGLDAESAAIVRAIVREEAEAGGVVIASTHDFSAMAGIARQAVVLRAGRVAAARSGDGALDEASLRALYAG